MATQAHAAVLLPVLLLSSAFLSPSLGAYNPERSRAHCLRHCQRIQNEPQRKECERHCIDRYGGQEEKGRGHNPYYYGEQSYEHWTRSPHGNFKVLERFTKRSELLRGIENYRLAILEADPRTFLLPSHLDAEEVFYVIEGRGTITLLREQNRESYDIRRGDIMRIPSGLSVYLINKDDHEKLRIAMLLHPVNTPGHFEEYFGAGGKDPETYYTIFSNEVLEAAFNTPRDRLERLFGQQRKGDIIKATDEQIRAMSKSATEGGGWPFGHSHAPLNLLKHPSYSNAHGELYEAGLNDYRPLQDLDVDITIANISRGSMMSPNYNSRATKVCLVVEGRGYFEMACPHLSGESEGESEKEREERGQGRVTHYQKVRAEVSRGSVFVIPAGHPVAAVAYRGKNLQVLCFGIRAEGNKKYYLAGRNNVLRQMEREAKELSFDRPASEVDEVLDAQPETVFLPGPERRREEGRGRHHNLNSFMDYAFL